MLAIRSKDRESGTSSAFRIKLNQPARGRYWLSHVLIPNAMYTVRPDCNRLRVSQAGVQTEVAVPSGFYTSTSLLAALETQMAGFTFALDPVTLRLTIANPGAFALLWAGLENSIAPVLGFPPVDTGLASAHTGTELMDLTYRHLTFNVLVEAPGVDFGVTNTKGHHSSFMVGNTENSLDYIVWDERQRYPQQILFRTPVRELHVSLTDSEFQPVDLNGAEWHMIWRPVLA